MKYIPAVITASLLTLSGSVFAQDAEFTGMSFFVTSEGPGNGGDLGGLAGADAHCQALATAAGAGNRTWRAYLSAETVAGQPRLNARDRIGSGPWYNANGTLIASNVSDLHLYNRTIDKNTALDENGNQINGVGDSPNRHDILTGTQADGTAFFPDEADHTCNNWTSSGEGSASVGHSDRHGGGNLSWNAAHPSAGCSQQALIQTGGDGLFYCFAAD
tara:strand:- start:111821 stop:112471 length:651 start_codon:yes stop_codon:yes gene_type:complete